MATNKTPIELSNPELGATVTKDRSSIANELRLGTDFESHELKFRSFVIRLWKEETGIETPGETWRGHIIPIPGDERQYFTDIDQLPALISPHLNKHG